MLNKKTNIIEKNLEDRKLSFREQAILQAIIHNYILNAQPVGSRNLAKYLENELNLSPATIRNVMSDLEDMEFISHPHTSAGRVPTDKGYRFYVDSMMLNEALTKHERKAVLEKLIQPDSDSVLKDASKVLGMLSHYLGLVEIPNIKNLIIRHLDILILSTSRLLVVLDLDSNNIRTVTLETDTELAQNNLENIVQYINDRISGRPLSFIRDNFRNLLSDYPIKESALIRLFVDSVEKLIGDKSSDRFHIAGTQNLLSYPEFEDLRRVKGIIELVENEDIIIHLLDKIEPEDRDIHILIGNELSNKHLEDCSLIISNYKLGSASGSIGLIGPKRMNYSRMVSLVQYVSEIISKQ